MKPLPLPFLATAILSLCASSLSHAQVLVLSKADSAHAAARKEAYTVSANQEEAARNWNNLASTNVPIYSEHTPGGPSVDIYIPNPGIGYCVLSCLSEQRLWQTQESKIKIGDELIGATKHKNEKGETQYWALWAPHGKSYLLKDRMREYGITPARVIYPAKLSLLDLSVKDYKVGFADLWIGKNVDNREVLLHGKPCEDYLFAHAPSRVVYSIPAGVASFSAWGVRPDGDSNVTGSWSYIVKIDGKEAFHSKLLEEYPGMEAPIEVAIPAGSRELELIVDPAKNSYANHSIWAQPTFKFQDRRLPNPRTE